MTTQIVIWLLAAAAACLLILAVWHERQMQRHRQPGVSYRDVTFRRDGGWRRSELFTPEGLRHQRRASSFGVAAVVVLIVVLVARALL